MMLADARREVLLPALRDIGTRLKEIAHRYAELPMLGRTHGQPATPTTLGKEIANFVARLSDEIARIEACELRGKINGAVGNYNAHVLAYPDVDWELVARRFVESFGSIQFLHNADRAARLYGGALRRVRQSPIHPDRSQPGPVELHFHSGTSSQKLREDHVGSSTMPHKVEPHQFREFGGNLGLANALLRHFSEKLPISRWQRDLTDSTGVTQHGSPLSDTACSAMFRAVKDWKSSMSMRIALPRISSRIGKSLAEPIQTVHAPYGVADAYEQL